MGVIIFNGVSSKSLGIVVESPPDYNAPERDFDVYHVPGKSGDIYVDQGSFQNVTRSYDIALGGRKADFQNLTKTVTDWLYSTNKYAQLSDSYDSQYFRLAVFKGPVTITNLLNRAGRATIEFDCKPYRYLRSGDRPGAANSATFTITNPTIYDSKPLIKIGLASSGAAGTVTVGSKTITIASGSGVNTVYVDSELQDCYYNTTNLNPYVTFGGDGEFPVLQPGDTTISMTGNVSYVQIEKARWYVL